MRRLHEAASSDADARLAIQMFCYSVRKQLAAMIAALDGVDLIVFTGGIGENDGEVRAAICDGLSWSGVVSTKLGIGRYRIRSAIPRRAALCCSPLAGRRADRPSHLGIVPQQDVLTVCPDGCRQMLSNFSRSRGSLERADAANKPQQSQRSSSMDQRRNLAMREHFERLAAEDDRRDAVAAKRGHDDEVTAFRRRGIDDRPVGMLMLDMDRVACHARHLRGASDGAENLAVGVKI
jgi:hypothetical protein